MIDQENNWRAHWRLIFDVIDGVPRMQQEITIWSKDPGWPAVRLAYEIKELYPTREQNVHYGPSWVELDDGYLEYETNIDNDILNLLKAKGIPIEGRLQGLSVPVGEENIYIRADVSLADGARARRNPIFFYPQDDGHSIQLAELFNPVDGERGVEWIVSGQFYRLEELFLLKDSSDSRHGLRVRQDGDEHGDHFDFYVDSIPIGVGSTYSSHQFAPGRQRFYLGHTPRYGLNLTGRIYHVTFDPNNSCAKCPRPTRIRPSQD